MILDLKHIEPKVIGTSQKGQDSFIDYIFKNIVNPVNKYYIEFGAVDGYLNSNTSFLRKIGWTGLLIDDNFENKDINLIKRSLTRNNILEVFEHANVPNKPDFLCIDIDGNDVWLAQKILEKYVPSVIMIEANIRFDPTVSMAQKYTDSYKWNGKEWCGCSPLGIKKLLEPFGYKIVHLHLDDAILIRSDLIKDYQTLPLEQLYSSNHQLYESHNGPTTYDNNNWTVI